MTINELIAHYTTAKILNSSLPPALSEKLQHLSRVFGAMDVGCTGAEIVKAAQAAWPTATAGTRKRYLVQLRAVMRRAERDGLIPKAPLIDVPFVHDTVYVDITGAEVKLLLDYIEWTEPKWYPLALVLAHTGARLGEALSLKPASFTRFGTRIAKPIGHRSKTVERVVPYTGRMSAALARGTLTRTDRLAPAGIADDSVSTCLGRVIDTSVKALGLPPLRVHDLRHAFAAVLAENGADLADIGSALGHSTPAMSMRYRGMVRSKLTSIISNI